VASDGIMQDYQSAQTAFQTVDQFGADVKGLGQSLTNVHEDLQSSLSDDDTGFGAMITGALSDVVGVAGKVFTEGGRVLSEMGTRGRTNTDRNQNTDETIGDAFDKIHQDHFGGGDGPAGSGSPDGSPADLPGPSDPSDPSDLSDPSAGSGRVGSILAQGTDAADRPDETDLATQASSQVPDGEAAVHLAGAGGPWPTEDEQPGGAVGQSTDMSCVSASGELLSQGTLKQSDLIAAIGDPASLEQLRDQFNQAGVGGSSAWKAGALPSDDLYSALVGTGRPFIAEMKNPNLSVAHAVVVTGGDGDHIQIADPADGGSTYKMTWSDFFQWRSGRVMFNAG
jgi:hypothetical protein